MDHVADIQASLAGSELDALLIPSTDAFISEFAPPSERRLAWATGFSGSTGLAIVTRNAAALFLDGRYALQGQQEIGEARIDIEAATRVAKSDWLSRILSAGARIGIDPRMHPISDFEEWQSIARTLDLHLHSLAFNPIDALWDQSHRERHDPLIVDYPVQFAGRPREAKCADLVDHIRADRLVAMLVSDPEDVAWLLNVRAHEQSIKVDVATWPIVPSSRNRLLVYADGHMIWYVDTDRIDESLKREVSSLLSFSSPGGLVSVLGDFDAGARIGADRRMLPADLAMRVEGKGELIADDYVARRRWVKDPRELENARRVHIIDAAAVVKLMAWLNQAVRTRTVDEFEVAAKIETLRSKHPDYLGASMPCMAASGISGAQPHYVPRRGNSRRLNEHPLFWMDSGGQYRGGTTDNTITMAVGTPEPRHVTAHTLVLKGFIALATSHIPSGIKAYSLNAIARQALWREGMDFAHGTGHGVGNLLNIHEGPMISSVPGPLSDVPIKAGMIVTNEPGYYAEGNFGLRIESHLAVVDSCHAGFLKFDTISRLPIDPRLVDFAILTQQERQWLSDYHEIVLHDLSTLLDRESTAWLQRITTAFHGQRSTMSAV